MERYWSWLIRGSGGKPGYRRLFNGWMLGHTAIGFSLAYLVPKGIEDSANAVLFPLTGILVGLTFAWAGNAQALMQTTEVNDLADQHQGGFSDYVYAYQTAIMVILVTITCWGLGGLGVFDLQSPFVHGPFAYFFAKWFLFTLSSLTVRVCWQVVCGAGLMLMAQKIIKDARKK